jgi:hypothetical protein
VGFDRMQKYKITHRPACRINADTGGNFDNNPGYNGDKNFPKYGNNYADNNNNSNIYTNSDYYRYTNSDFYFHADKHTERGTDGGSGAFLYRPCISSRRQI